MRGAHEQGAGRSQHRVHAAQRRERERPNNRLDRFIWIVENFSITKAIDFSGN